MTESVVLVDESDKPVGQAEKLEAHRLGLLHRAFSVFVFDPQGELLLQQRAASKYHAAGLWANTCCGHPRPGEDLVTAAHRRLREELGLSCRLSRAGQLTYRLTLLEGLIEHEVDHVLVGVTESEPAPNPAEVQAVRWLPILAVMEAVKTVPQIFAPWFRLALEQLLLEPAVDA